jgi:hypothetical protein
MTPPADCWSSSALLMVEENKSQEKVRQKKYLRPDQSPKKLWL